MATRPRKRKTTTTTVTSKPGKSKYAAGGSVKAKTVTAKTRPSGKVKKKLSTTVSQKDIGLPVRRRLGFTEDPYDAMMRATHPSTSKAKTKTTVTKYKRSGDVKKSVVYEGTKKTKTARGKVKAKTVKRVPKKVSKQQATAKSAFAEGMRKKREGFYL